jgi:hypothetical protein
VSKKAQDLRASIKVTDFDWTFFETVNKHIGAGISRADALREVNRSKAWYDFMLDKVRAGQIPFDRV